MPEPEIAFRETCYSKPTLGIHHFAVTIYGVESAFIAWCIKCLMEEKLHARVIAAYDQKKHVAYYFYRLID